MRRFAFAIFVVATYCAQASAQDLKVKDCLEVFAAASSLDTYQRVVGDKSVTTPYRLGTVRFAIAQIISAVRPINEDVEQARLKMISEITDGKPIQPNSPEHIKLNDAYKKILERPCTAKLPRIKVGDLNVGDDPGQNPIPPAVLSALDPVLDK